MPQPEALGPAPAHLEQGHAPVEGTCGTQTADLESALSESGRSSVYPPPAPQPPPGSALAPGGDAAMKPRGGQPRAAGSDRRLRKRTSTSLG